MVDDPRDRKAYQIAIAFLGFAAVAAFGGIAWVCAEHWCVKNIPNELWFGGGAIFGAFVGCLIPVPLPRPKDRKKDWVPPLVLAVLSVGLIGLAFVLGLLAVKQAEHESFGRVALYVTFGGLLLGLLIPSPARRDR
jgi:uncharacterized protein YqgC (DUF456 family)